MTTYTVNAKPGPRIHALVIGVGNYLYGGTHYPAGSQLAGLLRPITELTCAPLSAKHVAGSLFEADWTASPIKLGTVELLLSPTTPVLWSADGGATAPERALFSEVRAAGHRWFEKCNSSEDNIALLYFCGHGWGSLRRYLLVEDFGEKRDEWDEHLIDFTKTRTAMLGCRARTQCFFLDTCSVDPDQLAGQTISAKAMVPNPLKESDPYMSIDNPIFSSSRPSLHVEAQEREVTPFAAAIVRTLNGLGAAQYGDNWEITTGNLPTRLGEVMAWYGPPEAANEFYPVPGDAWRWTMMRRLPKAPLVPFKLGCLPRSALGSAEWELRCLESNKEFRRAPLCRVWSDEVPASAYRLTVTFPDNSHESVTQPSRVIHPPPRPYDVTVKQSPRH
ncbi:hypothetical protein ACIGT4_27150 [Streptomyces sioyaensis]|uniref:hypothetical protein n=1 Tax=Streptomyces sioyaensis TaxID=67364 RepID=UPI0037D0E5FE